MHIVGKHALAVAALISASAFAQTVTRTFHHDIDLVGTVSGLPANVACSVALSDVGGYADSKQAVCQRDGSFEFPRVPPGIYNLVVKEGPNEYSEQLNLEAPREQVDIQIPSIRSNGGDGNTVSVAEMRIPEKAKDDLRKANSELAKGQLDKADELAQKALATAPQFARAVTLRAVIMMTRRDFNSALNLIDQSTKMDPMLALTQVVRASVLNSVGRPNEAQAAAEQALRLGGSWQAHYELARALMIQHHFRQALAEITKATAVAPPKFGELMLLRASALMNLKDLSGARDTLAAFLKEWPGDPRATQMMAVLKGR